MCDLAGLQVETEDELHTTRHSEGVPECLGPMSCPDGLRGSRPKSWAGSNHALRT